MKIFTKILKELSELDNIEIYGFIDFLKMGYENEWDCNLSDIENFGAYEFRIAALEGTKLAKHWESNVIHKEGDDLSVQ